MSKNFIDAIDAEIQNLEERLAGNSDYTKLRALEALRLQYQGDVVKAKATSHSRSSGSANASVSAGRPPSADKLAILNKAKMFVSSQSGPTPTRIIHSHLTTDQNMTIPGANPINSLSAMLSNSDDFESHGKAGWTLVIDPSNQDGSSSFGGSDPASAGTETAGPHYQ